uniref:Ribosomal protein S13 n=1 Tax=Gefionella okellyi TaxID=2853422 RepID=A0A0B5GSI8_9EUKA|nr:ribosomal protein S13 [Gefionella okellyi]
MNILTKNYISNHKYLNIALQKIKGISYNTSFKLCNHLRIGLKYKKNNINNKLLYYKNQHVLNYLIKNKILLNEDLSLFIKKNIKRYITNKHYKGYLLKKGYPIRGQRTRTNANTIKKLYINYL